MLNFDTGLPVDEHFQRRCEKSLSGGLPRNACMRFHVRAPVAKFIYRAPVTKWSNHSPFTSRLVGSFLNYIIIRVHSSFSLVENRDLLSPVSIES